MDNALKQDHLPQRLCSEIQLFDLCDLTSCGFKSGRFCSNSELLRRFEGIAEQEVRLPDRIMDEELDGDEEADGDFYDYEAGPVGNDEWEDE
ncbi:MAG: hypothetical protein A2X82_19360 [Geobacteraceae bacterium GWC2_55_20]|nr:MAG: hypothetical protein A2X82_19360 [Geobacteraceae bacterium GWC2_55_20]OGU26603.1 MAG: hypothetical protein A2X85_07490 [Geobacteraceae bacterium GWF2_54_21]HBA71821.1 hypothetical protein [Geobacter sp.]HCE66200.1 hypothetical protein [Geobacter sp.]